MPPTVAFHTWHVRSLYTPPLRVDSAFLRLRVRLLFPVCCCLASPTDPFQRRSGWFAAVAFAFVPSPRDSPVYSQIYYVVCNYLTLCCCCCLPRCLFAVADRVAVYLLPPVYTHLPRADPCCCCAPPRCWLLPVVTLLIFLGVDLFTVPQHLFIITECHWFTACLVFARAPAFIWTSVPAYSAPTTCLPVVGAIPPFGPRIGALLLYVPFWLLLLPSPPIPPAPPRITRHCWLMPDLVTLPRTPRQFTHLPLIGCRVPPPFALPVYPTLC